MTVATRQTDFLHFTLVMLERYVRKPLEGTVVDEYLFLPAKLLYRQSKKELTGHRTKIMKIKTQSPRP